jgi:hypothetical protein
MRKRVWKWIFLVAVGGPFLLLIALAFVFSKARFHNQVQLTGNTTSFQTYPPIPAHDMNLLDPSWKTVMSFSAKITAESDSFFLKIYSPLRLEPFKIIRGDELILEGEFVIKVFSENNVSYINLNGTATSARKNEIELLPSIVRSWRDWLLAVAAFTVGWFAFWGFIGRLFFEWPLREQLQGESTKIKRTKSKKSTKPKRSKTKK